MKCRRKASTPHVTEAMHEPASPVRECEGERPPLIYTKPYGTTFATVFFVPWLAIVGGSLIFGSYSELH